MLPLKFLRITAYGKKILFHLEKDVTIMSGLGMTGHWVYEKENNSNLWFVYKTNESDKLEDPDGSKIPKDDGSKIIKEESNDPDGSKIKESNKKLYYDDARKFGNINIFLDVTSLEKKLNKLGPDVLNDKVKSEEWLEIFRKKKYENREIHDVIRDESCICGIGNYLRAEILYRARIRPLTLVSDLTDEQLEVLRKKTHKVIRESYAAGGLTIESFWDAYGKKGLFKPQVYRKKKDPDGRKVHTLKDKKNYTLYYVKY